MLVVRASRSQINLRDEVTSSNNVTKNVIFIRHAESAGNAKIFGAIEKGRWDAFKDGELTRKGTTATEQKVADIIDWDTDLIKHVLRSDIVLVSPLRRAMATAMIFLAKAKQLLRDKDLVDEEITMEIKETVKGHQDFAFQHPPNTAADLLPEIRVHADLREKYGSESDKPGADETEHPLEYVHRIAQHCGKHWFGDEHALDMTYQQIQASYVAEESRTHGWLPDAVDGYTFANQIRKFKDYLKGIIQRNVFIVGHNGWSRFAFASFLPAGGEENVERNMRFGTRKVLPLRNLGIIQATFDNGFFTEATIREGDATGSAKWAMLVSRTEALAKGVVPAGMYFKQILVWKVKPIHIRSPTVRLILTFAQTAQGVKTLAWTDKWGAIGDVAKDCVEISKNRHLAVYQTKRVPATFDIYVAGSKVFSFTVDSQWTVQLLQQLVPSYGVFRLIK